MVIRTLSEVRLYVVMSIVALLVTLVTQPHDRLKQNPITINLLSCKAPNHYYIQEHRLQSYTMKPQAQKPP